MRTIRKFDKDGNVSYEEVNREQSEIDKDNEYEERRVAMLYLMTILICLFVGLMALIMLKIMNT